MNGDLKAHLRKTGPEAITDSLDEELPGLPVVGTLRVLPTVGVEVVGGDEGRASAR